MQKNLAALFEKEFGQQKFGRNKMSTVKNEFNKIRNSLETILDAKII